MTGWTYGQGWVSMALGYRLFFRKFCSRSKQRVIYLAVRIFLFRSVRTDCILYEL